MAFIGFVLSWYLFIAILFSFYCWAKRTDPMDDAFNRRLSAVTQALQWPVELYGAISERRQTRR